MIKSRQKNTRGNREFAALCRQAGFMEAGCHLGILQKGGLPGLSVEVRRTQRLHLENAMAAAGEAAGENIPVVAHRSDHQPWRITLGLDDFLLLYRAYLQTRRPDPAPPSAEAYPDSGPDPDHLPANDPAS